jgi:hypothetical protein
MTEKWDSNIVSRYRTLTDNSENSINVRALACRAFENHYQKSMLWEDLNPQVRDHWCQITAAILAALNEGN